MTSGLLPPDDGLWYLGEQNAEDTYMDIKSPRDGCFTVDVYELIDKGLFPDKYNWGYFHGWKIEDAEKYLEEITQ